MAYRVLITAGPTREYIDSVRFITNRSSGRMGAALAAAARDAGLETVLVCGPVSIELPSGIEIIRVETAAEMASAVHRWAPESDLVIMAAAVADYRPVATLDHKMKKLPGKLVLELERTEDILGTLGSCRRPGQTLVGFAAETENLLTNAAGKLERKHLDWIAANLVADGFGSDTDTIELLGRGGEHFTLGPAPKSEVAAQLLSIVLGKKAEAKVI